MAKSFTALEKQLNTEFNKEAEDCIRIYEALRKINEGLVWSTQWNILVGAVFDQRYQTLIYRPSKIGNIFLKGLQATH